MNTDAPSPSNSKAPDTKATKTVAKGEAAQDLMVRFQGLLKEPSSRLMIIALALTLCVTLFVFRGAIANLFERWGTQEELSHSYFIPLISAWLVWSNREAVIKSIGSPSMLGLGLGVLAGAMLLAGQLAHAFILQQLAIVVAVAALVAGFGGRSLLKITAVPILYLLFAIPPPFWVITNLSWNFQTMSSVLGVAMIKMMNIPVFLSGNVIDLGSYKLAVAEACSGLRYLFPFLSLGFLSAYLFKAPMWQRIIVFLSTIPITIFMNSLRIAITGALVQAYGTSHVEGFLHLFEGWVVFVLCLLALLAVVAAFCLILPPRRHVLDAMGVPELKPVPLKTPKYKFTHPVLLGSIAAAFALSWFASLFITVDKLSVPERKLFVTLPFEFEGWKHSVQPIDSEIAEVLGADDSIVFNLEAPDRNLYNVYLAYLTARRDGRSWHSPRQCIPGGGWQVTSFDIVKANDSDEGLPYNYNRMVIENRGQKQIVYYWYDQRGRKLANEYVMKLWVIYDTLVKQRADGSLVRLMTPLLDKESEESADQRLREMARSLNSKLSPYVPA